MSPKMVEPVQLFDDIGLHISSILSYSFNNIMEKAKIK